MAVAKRKTRKQAPQAGRQRERATGVERLQFVHSGKLTGFRSAGISAYNNVDPQTVIRELVQNSLDAAIKAKRDVVRVAFEVEEVDAALIPARAQYEKHLRCAVDTQRKKGNLGQSASIVEVIEGSLAAQRVPVLWVLDNGTGLDGDGMESLLGDGQSGKDDESTAGSYGNGHMTSFPASDLRYVVYGGVHGGGRTVSGHAILASHAYRSKMCGEDGYIAKAIRPDDLFSRFDFYSGSRTPLLKDKLDRIEEEHGTGSVVGILGFNRFNRYENDEEVLDIIETVAATHFMPLIRKGGMEVGVRAPGGASRTVDRSTLEEILGRKQLRERRDRNSIGPSGRQAWETLETLKPEHGRMIETQAGSVRFHFRELAGSGGGTHLQLFRNGMWISNDIRYNQGSDYRGTMPFSGVVLLEPDGAKAACGLIREFEGPRHIDIDLTRQQRGSAKRKALEEFLKELRDGVLELVPAMEAKEHDPGFFSVEVTGDGVRRNPRARLGGTGTPERVASPQPQRTQQKGRGKRRRGGIRRQGRRIDAQVTAVRQARGMRVRAKPMEDAANAELRVVLANGSDETCDNPEPEQFLEVGKGAKMDGKRVKGYVRDDDGKRFAVLLGPVTEDSGELDIWLPCRPPEDGAVRIEMVRRAAAQSKA